MSHDGWNFVAEEVRRHETESSVVMNCAACNDGKRTWLAAGQESHCQLYNVTSRVVTLENGEVLKGISAVTKENLRQRKRSESLENENTEAKDDNGNIKHKKLQLILKPSTSIQTDFR